MTQRKKEAFQAWVMGIGLILVLMLTNYVAMNI